MTIQAPPEPSRTRPTGAPSSATSAEVPFVPKPPATFQEAGLDPGIVEALILKHLMAVGSASGADIARELCMPPEPILDYLAALKQQQIVIHVGAATMGDFRYALTDTGRDRGQRFMIESMYVGPAPVSVDAYIRAVAAQSITRLRPGEEHLRDAFSDLLISEDMFNTLGPAINSGRGMFLYGPPGNGKSSIAERITKCFGDDVYIPRAVIVDGLIIKLFDAAVHEEIPRKRDSIIKQNQIDERWVKIRRPTVIAGGELTMDALEVQYNSTAKTCEAPLQMKSNCGTLVIDDFGRQRMAPIELLNRWIVPLEKRHDFLALPNGKKIRIPFDQLIIFSTNLEPKTLCDEAFLRRIPYKINIADPTEEQFRALFELVGPKLGIQIDESARKAVDYLIERYYRRQNRPFRCCQPRDLLLQVRNRCLYLGRPTELTAEMLDNAVAVYFTVM